MNPLVSVVTVVYNGSAGIERTILSVLPHLDASTEYVLLDGGSTDGTVDIIRKYSKKITYWKSEPDNGIYDALNKAALACKGHFIITINVGDVLLAVPQAELKRAVQEKADVAAFNVKLTGGSIFRPSIGPSLRFRNTIPHQGAFYRRTSQWAYNLSYKIYADFDLNQRLYKDGRKFMIFDKLVSYHALDGASAHRKNFSEYYRIMEVNFGTMYCLIGRLYLNYSLFKHGLRRLISG